MGATANNMRSLHSLLFWKENQSRKYIFTELYSGYQVRHRKLVAPADDTDLTSGGEELRIWTLQGSFSFPSAAQTFVRLTFWEKVSLRHPIKEPLTGLYNASSPFRGQNTRRLLAIHHNANRLPPTERMGNANSRPSIPPNLPNSGISPHFIAEGPSAPVVAAIFTALEHRHYNRYIAAEQTLSHAFSQAATPRDYVSLLVEQSILYMHMGVAGGPPNLRKLAEKVSSLPPGILPPIELLPKQDEARETWDIDSMDLRCVTEVERDLVGLLACTKNRLGKKEAWQALLVGCHRKYSGYTNTQYNMSENEVYIHEVYHKYALAPDGDTGFKARQQAQLFALLSRLVAKNRYDQAISLMQSIDSSGHKRLVHKYFSFKMPSGQCSDVQFRPLYKQILASPSVTKHQFLSVYAYIRIHSQDFSKILDPTGFDQLCTECGDPFEPLRRQLGNDVCQPHMQLSRLLAMKDRCMELVLQHRYLLASFWLKDCANMAIESREMLVFTDIALELGRVYRAMGEPLDHLFLFFKGALPKMKIVRDLEQWDRAVWLAFDLFGNRKDDFWAIASRAHVQFLRIEAFDIKKEALPETPWDDFIKISTALLDDGLSKEEAATLIVSQLATRVMQLKLSLLEEDGAAAAQQGKMAIPQNFCLNMESFAERWCKADEANGHFREAFLKAMCLCYLPLQNIDAAFAPEYAAVTGEKIAIRCYQNFMSSNDTVEGHQLSLKLNEWRRVYTESGRRPLHPYLLELPRMQTPSHMFGTPHIKILAPATDKVEEYGTDMGE
ncbi:uncharacterized protein BDR25DRAFT_355685 [Lindgomyces ingoldianus]|uniref:Uncharacterized protein n=1 Tax=Lindgomyces ingoldianus TaxID=673940 RepID=A0ACB6QTR4_9PLEO|nr:uncharacterized protein BDR25DRAFT_355685 [Lindgomyces ingoldianus]KAF2469958.1 hypothetical protein BDR25DRAFT_355685 [Lindgomyces ingoldianus]